MRKYNIEPKRIRHVFPNINSNSNLILIEGRKNALPGIIVEKPLYIHNLDASYTKEVIEMFGER